MTARRYVSSRTARLIAVEVGDRHGVAADDIFSASRFRRVVHARWHAFHLLSEAGVPAAHLGRLFNRDHSTVLHGLKRAAAMFTTTEGGIDA